QVDRAEDRLVLAGDVSGAGGGVELAGGDQVQGLETLPAARVRLVQRGPTQVLHRLLPLRRLHLDHPPAPRWVVVGAIAPPYPIPALRNGNSWFHPDRGLASGRHLARPRRSRPSTSPTDRPGAAGASRRTPAAAAPMPRGPPATVPTHPTDRTPCSGPSTGSAARRSAPASRSRSGDTGPRRCRPGETRSGSSTPAGTGGRSP